MFLKLRLVLFVGFLADVLHADPVAEVAAAAQGAFANMPVVRRVDAIAGKCGADLQVNQRVAYCTSQNTIFLSRSAAARPEAAYQVAHLFGHAVQVQHGVADFALAEIRARRSEEATLRGYVARQVECIAGYLFWRAGLPEARLGDWMDQEPFTGSHWGRNPLRIGPQVSIGLGERDEWFQLGQAGDISACAPGEFTADLLVGALRE